MAIHFGCGCGNTISVDESLKGKRVRCPACSKDIVVPGASTGEPASDSGALIGRPPPRPVMSGPVRSCPSCGRPIPREAGRCRFCGAAVAAEPRTPGQSHETWGRVWANTCAVFLLLGSLVPVVARLPKESPDQDQGTRRPTTDEAQLETVWLWESIGLARENPAYANELTAILVIPPLLGLFSLVVGNAGRGGSRGFTLLAFGAAGLAAEIWLVASVLSGTTPAPFAALETLEGVETGFASIATLFLVVLASGLVLAIGNRLRKFHPRSRLAIVLVVPSAGLLALAFCLPLEWIFDFLGRRAGPAQSIAQAVLDPDGIADRPVLLVAMTALVLAYSAFGLVSALPWKNPRLVSSVVSILAKVILFGAPVFAVVSALAVRGHPDPELWPAVSMATKGWLVSYGMLIVPAVGLTALLESGIRAAD